MARPEHLAPPEFYYNDSMAKKYSQNTRIIQIQTEMTERAIELLMLPENEQCLILDIGCGSGLSGAVLDEMGHHWVGMDISKAMLDIAIEREVEGQLILSDMGDGCPFRPAMFDGAISVSALQWLCNKDRTDHNPVQRIYKFFSSLFSCLTRSARAVFQFYPENAQQIELLMSQSMKAGFYGGLVVDYPNSKKAKKHFLVLMTGGAVPMPKALGDNNEKNEVTIVHSSNNNSSNNKKSSKKNKKTPMKSKEWILKKKNRRLNQGKETKRDSKYTGRSRRRF